MRCIATATCWGYHPGQALSMTIPLPGVEHEYAIEDAHGMPYSELKDFDPEDMCSTIPEPEPGSQGTPISERDTAWLESCITSLSTDLEAGDEGDSASGEEIEEPEATTRSARHILVPETDRAIVMEQRASPHDVHPTSAFSRFRHKIGRASCRERL